MLELALEQIMIENPRHERPAKVLLMGDCVFDETFQAALLQALRNQMTEMPEVLSKGSDSVASKGAAQLHIRIRYYTYKTVTRSSE